MWFVGGHTSQAVHRTLPSSRSADTNPVSLTAVIQHRM